MQESQDTASHLQYLARLRCENLSGQVAEDYECPQESDKHAKKVDGGPDFDGATGEVCGRYTRGPIPEKTAR